MTELFTTRGRRSRLGTDALPDDPDIREFAETLLDELTLGVELALAEHKSRQPRPLQRAGSALGNALRDRLEQMGPRDRDLVMERASKSLEARRLPATRIAELAASGDPIGRLIDEPPVQPASRIIRKTVEGLQDAHRVALDTDDETLGPGFVSEQMDHKTGAFDATYAKFRKQLGERKGKPSLVKDHRGRGCFVLTCEKGQIILGPTEPFAIYGTVNDRFNAEGGLAKFPGGPPITHVQKFADGGAGVDFHDGYSLFRKKGGKVCIIRGAIRKKWKAEGGPLGGGGYPEADEGRTEDAVGRRCFTTTGLFLHHPEHGTFFIPYPLLDQWHSLGGLKSILGWPIADATRNPVAAQHPGSGLWLTQRFEGGQLIQPSPATPAMPVLPVTKVVGKLTSLEVARKTDEGANWAEFDEPYLGGVVIDVNGTSRSLGPISLGKKWRNGERRTLNLDVATWSLPSEPFPGWPVPCTMVAIFMEKDQGKHLAKIVESAWDDIETALRKAIEKGGQALGALLSTWIGPLGTIIGKIVAWLGSWILGKLMHRIKQLLADDVFEPLVIGTQLADGWHENGEVLARVENIRAVEHNPVQGKPARYDSWWEIRATK